MRFLIVLSALVALAVSQDTYDSKHDHLVDVDALLKQDGALKSWFNCFVDLGPCDTVQSSFKANMAEGVQTACAKCPATQKVILRKFLDALKQYAPADYEAFKKKFDPENKHFEALKKAIA